MKRTNKLLSVVIAVVIIVGILPITQFSKANAAATTFTNYFKVLAACKGNGLTFVGDKSAAVTAKVK